MLAPLVIPPAQPPHPISGYKMPTTDNQLLTWDFVAQEMATAQFYWLSTVNLDGSPHVAPVWGIWHLNRIQFDGHYETRWAKNLFANPSIAVHLPSAEKVVIIYGKARTLGDDELTEKEWALVDGLFRRKYEVDWGSPYWVVQPTKVMAWSTPKLTDMTRWIFET